jgi:rSAM/selenodomain-associated transferase 2
MSESISIIVPVLNEIEQLPELLAHLMQCQRHGCEVLLVDGGSTDGTADTAETIGYRVIRSAPGRARQMNAGADLAQGDILIFLHADTKLPPHAKTRVREALATGHVWGRFDVRIAGKSWLLPLIAFCMNWRSRLSGIATGDQALFVCRRTFQAMGGFPEQPLMEDIEFSTRMRRFSPPACLRDRVTTSGRRWDERGTWQTICLMWRLRFAYWRGASAFRLAEYYR